MSPAMIPIEEVVLKLNFAKKSLYIQGEIQNFYWNNLHSTFHHFVAYWNLSENEKVLEHASVISTPKEHKSIDASTFLKDLIPLA